MGGAPRRRLAGPALRFLLLVIVVGAGFALLRWGPWADRFEPEALVAGFRRLAASPWAPAVLVAAFALLSPLGVPVSPLILAGGLVFGFAWGTALNVLGTWLGAAATYGLGRALGAELFEKLFGDRLRRLETTIERHGFWTLVRLRFIPIPYALVNYAAAFAGVRPAVFLTSTALGLAPAVAVYTWFAAALFRLASEPGRATAVGLQFLAALALMLGLTFVVPRLLARGRAKEGE